MKLLAVLELVSLVCYVRSKRRGRTHDNVRHLRWFLFDDDEDEGNIEGQDEEEIIENDTPCVDLRYIPWADLTASNRETAEQDLLYEEESWDVEQTHTELENESWEELSSSEKEGVEAINFTQQGWDCWVNHYESYTWEELEEEGLTDLLESVGYRKKMWDRDKTPKDDFFDKDWDELSDVEEQVADEFCFFYENWERLQLSLYNWSCVNGTPIEVDISADSHGA